MEGHARGGLLSRKPDRRYATKKPETVERYYGGRADESESGGKEERSFPVPLGN